MQRLISKRTGFPKKPGFRGTRLCAQSRVCYTFGDRERGKGFVRKIEQAICPARLFGYRWHGAVERQSLAAEPRHRGSQRYIRPTAATFPRYLGNAIIFFLGISSGLYCKISAITFVAYTCVRVVSSSASIERHPYRPSAYRSLPRGSCTVHFSL